MPTIFIAHSSIAKRLAVEFKSILTSDSPDLQVFLSSDWDSIVAGANWLQEIETALATHSYFIALITQADDARLPWICYEVGFARGRGLLPKVFVFGGIDPKEIPLPISGIQFVGTWDTNRWKMELLAMGVADIDTKESRLAKLFHQ
jgi:TIR domain